MNMKYPFVLPDLQFGFGELEPHIDAATMETHHDKHHATYVAKLNEAVAKHSEIQQKTIHEMLARLEEMPEDIRATVRNHGGGHLNHALFWEILSPSGGGNPAGLLSQKISENWAGIDAFKAEFENKAATLFGSGWVWLVMDSQKVLSIIQTQNQDSPVSSGLIPILGLDVWEHAYYLKYRSVRIEYIKAWWNVVNWSVVEKRFSNN